MPKFKYSWKPPIVREGDEDVYYYDHRGNLKHGVCRLIETRYSNGAARHNYGMKGDGHSRYTWIAEWQLVVSK